MLRIYSAREPNSVFRDAKFCDFYELSLHRNTFSVLSNRAR